jgi:GH24 family phage-related lysozyme (muramidase)
MWNHGSVSGLTKTNRSTKENKDGQTRHGLELRKKARGALLPIICRFSYQGCSLPGVIG